MTASQSIHHIYSVRLCLCALTAACVLPGCHLGNWKTPSFGLSSKDHGAGESIDDVSGPLQRVLMARRGYDPNAPLTGADKKDQELQVEGQRAYDAQEYATASKTLSGIVKRRSPNKFKLFESTANKRVVYDPIREEAAYYLAESEFQQQRYAAAQEHYTMLIEDYPSTRYMDESTRRLFSIAKKWLPVDEFATTSEIQQVNLEDRHATPLSNITPEERRFGWLPNFSDKTKPVLDTNGHALAALKTIWLNDPSGPLADDALMLSATFHLRSKNYREADRMLTILREEFPKSTHLQTAFVLGSHVKLMSYQGAKYEERQLEDARQLKESSLRLFSDLLEGDKIRGDLKKIHEARALRDWELVQFYEKKNKPRSVVVYCRQVIENFPETQYATLAREKLAEMNVATGANNSLEPTRADSSNGQQFRSEPAESPRPIVDEGPVFETSEPIFDDPSTGRASFGESSQPSNRYTQPTGRSTIDNIGQPANVGRARLQ